jgi:hypothetical protein
MAVDTPTDGQIAAYQASSGEFEWVDDSSGSPGGIDGDFQINNSGAFGGSILSTNKTTTITLNSGASGDPQIQMTSNTKSMTLKVDTNNKLKVEGALYSWVLDASSGTGGITFPDGTTQTTAASGGGGWTTPATELYSDYDEFCTLFPFCGRTANIANNGVNPSQGYCYPFIARKTGTVSQMTIDVNSATSGLTSMNVSIYTDGGGYPKDILGNGIFDASTTGIKSVTSFTDEGGSATTISTTEDVVYWVVWGSTDSFTAATNKIGGTSYSNSSVGFLPERSNGAFANRPLVCRHIEGGLSTWSGVQASYVATDWQPYGSSNYGVPIGVYLQY